MAFDVNKLPVVDPRTAAQLIQQAMGTAALAAAPAAPTIVTKPGVERWPVKTGTDDDVGQVKQQIVPATVEDMVQMPRPGDMMPVLDDFPAYQRKRAAPVETTIWQIAGHITTIKLEADGDYHLVLQGASGATMIAEIPTPDPKFVGASQFLDNIKAARDATDATLTNKISRSNFVPRNGILVPPESFVAPPPTDVKAATLQPGGAAGPQAFRTSISPVAATITGIGFFDKVHGQAGVSSSNGIELHPVLKLELT